MSLNAGTVVGYLELEDRLTPALKLAGTQLVTTGEQLTALGKSATSLGAALLPASLAVGAFGLGAIKLASDFESSFAGVRKTVDASEPELARLAQGFRDMSMEIPVTVNELNRIAEAGGQLGVKTSDLEGFTRTMAAMGEATNLSSDEAATSLAQIANIINNQAGPQYDRLGATIVALGNAGASTEKDITEFGLRLAGAGKIAGLSEAEILSIGSALASVGINAEAGGTAFSKVFTQIAQGVSQGGDAVKSFSDVAGVSAAQFAKTFKEEPAEAITEFVEGLGRINESGGDLFGTLDNLGISEQRMRDALLRSAGAGDLLRESIKTGNEAWEANTALTAEAEQRYGTFASQAKLLWNEISDVGITLGQALMPSLRDTMELVKPVIGAMADLAGWFGDLPQPIRTTTLAFGALFAIAAPGFIAIGTALTVAGIAFTGFGTAALATNGALFTLGNTVPVLTARIWLMEASAAAAKTSLGSFIVASAPLIVAVAGITAAVTIGYQAWQLYKESSERTAAAGRQQTTDAANLARINATLGTSFTDLNEAVAAANEHSAKLRDGTLGVVQGFSSLEEALRSGRTGSGVIGSVRELTDAEKELQKQQEAANLARLTAEALSAQTIINARRARLDAIATLERANLNAIGEAEIAAQAAELQRLTAVETAKRAEINAAGVAEIEAYGAVIVAKDAAAQIYLKNELEMARVIEAERRREIAMIYDMGNAFLDLGEMVGGTAGTIVSSIGAIYNAALRAKDGFADMKDGFSKLSSGSILSGLSGVASGVGGILQAANMAIAAGKALAKVFGFGPSKEELEGRSIADAFRSDLVSTLTAAQKLEAQMSGPMSGASLEWAQSTIAVRDALRSVGVSEQEALAWGQKLWESEKKGGDAVSRTIGELSAMLTKGYVPAGQEAATIAALGWSETIKLIQDAQKATFNTAETTLTAADMERNALLSIGSLMDHRIAQQNQLTEATRQYQIQLESTRSTAFNNSDRLSPGAFPTFESWRQNWLSRNIGGETSINEWDELVAVLGGDPHQIWPGQNIPGFATGGIVSQPTVAMVAERGPELITPLAPIEAILQQLQEMRSNQQRPQTIVIPVSVGSKQLEEIIVSVSQQAHNERRIVTRTDSQRTRW